MAGQPDPGGRLAGDGAVIMVEWHGYGRAYSPGRRQIVGAMFHLADREPCRRLNVCACACAGEVRAPSDPDQPGPDLVIDVAELIWEPIAGSRPAGCFPPADAG